MEELSDPDVFKEQLQKCINHYQLVLQKIRSGSADSGIIRNLKLIFMVLNWNCIKLLQLPFLNHA